jgi:hypothetical protein
MKQLMHVQTAESFLFKVNSAATFAENESMALFLGEVGDPARHSSRHATHLQRKQLTPRHAQVKGA